MPLVPPLITADHRYPIPQTPGHFLTSNFDNWFCVFWSL
jgi:hypothetical protein